LNTVGRIAVRLLIGTVAVVTMAGAGFAIYADLIGRDALVLGGAIVDGKVVTAESAKRLVDHPVEWSAARYCRRDVLLSTGRIAAGVVEAIIGSGDVARVEPAVAGLERASRWILECSPGESIAWAWLAMAKNQSSGNDEEVRRLFERSQWTAPSDLWVIEIRLPEIARAFSRRGGSFGELARVDIRTLLAADHNAWYAARIMGPVFGWIGAIVQEEFTRIDDPIRREELIQAFGSERANIAGCSAQRFADWLYRGQRGSCETEDHIPNFDWKKPDRP